MPNMWNKHIDAASMLSLRLANWFGYTFARIGFHQESLQSSSPRVDGPFKIIEKIGENAYKLQLPDEYEISPMFNVKDLRAYHGEDLRGSLFSHLWGIDAGASINTPNIGNSALIIEELDWGVKTH